MQLKKQAIGVVTADLGLPVLKTYTYFNTTVTNVCILLYVIFIT